MRFRLATNSTVLTFPAGTVSWSDYEVRLAQAANPITSMSTTFQANLRNPVLVKDGLLSIGANQFSTGANPKISFANARIAGYAYVYQGGDLGDAVHAHRQ